MFGGHVGEDELLREPARKPTIDGQEPVDVVFIARKNYNQITLVLVLCEAIHHLVNGFLSIETLRETISFVDE